MQSLGVSSMIGVQQEAWLMNPHFPMAGRCTCGAVGFRMETAPLFVHCCHCTWCQRETGTAFALNAMIESNRLTLLHGEPEMVITPSNSGKGQKIVRCPTCRVALWSHYPGSGDAVSFVRVGTLEQPGLVPPDVHIFTSTKLPWVTLPADVPAVAEFYDIERMWPPESQERRKMLRRG